MRVLQIIDSLEAGGAERMAVNYANALADRIEFSGLVATRAEGVLKNTISDKVSFNFLKKKKILDFGAIQTLRKIVRTEKIDIIHVHGTSFFTAFLVKLVCFRIKVVFHEHYGERAVQSVFKNIPLLFCVLFFDKILVVNDQLKKWFIEKGFTKTVCFPNFASFDKKESICTVLKGEKGKRIVYLANLKKPKNHFFLIEAFQKATIKKQGWTLHLVGKKYHDDYFETIIKLLEQYELTHSIYIYDSQNDVKNILSQATVGIMSSTNEGFPVTLLEYGLAKLPVICSDVGFCPQLIKHSETGLLFNPKEVDDLVIKLQKMVESDEERNVWATQLNELVVTNYSEEKITTDLLSIYKELKK